MYVFVFQQSQSCQTSKQHLYKPPGAPQKNYDQFNANIH